MPEIAYQLPVHVNADVVGIPEADRPEVVRLADLTMCEPRMRVIREDVRAVRFRPTRDGSPGTAVPIRVNARTDYRITDPLSRGRCDVGVGVVAVSPGIPEGFW